MLSGQREERQKRNGVPILVESESSREPQNSEGVFLTHKPLGWLCAMGLTRPLECEPSLVLHGFR